MRQLTIYKYEIPNIGVRNTLTMPEGARIVHFAEQISALHVGSGLCVWAQVDKNQPLEARDFVIKGTGHLIEEGLVYVATAQSGPYVWHLHEVLAHG